MAKPPHVVAEGRKPDYSTSPSTPKGTVLQGPPTHGPHAGHGHPERRAAQDAPGTSPRACTLRAGSVTMGPVGLLHHALRGPSCQNPTAKAGGLQLPDRAAIGRLTMRPASPTYSEAGKGGGACVRNRLPASRCLWTAHAPVGSANVLRADGFLGATRYARFSRCVSILPRGREARPRPRLKPGVSDGRAEI